MPCKSLFSCVAPSLIIPIGSGNGPHGAGPQVPAGDFNIVAIDLN